MDNCLLFLGHSSHPTFTLALDAESLLAVDSVIEAVLLLWDAGGEVSSWNEQGPIMSRRNGRRGSVSG